MDDELPTWSRPHLTPGGSDASITLLVFGQFAVIDSIRFPRYRSAGLPPEMTFKHCTREDDEPMFRRTESSDNWALAAPRNPASAATAKQAPECIILQGTIPNPTTLDYWRDLIGFVMCLFDAGATAVLDTSGLIFWSPETWREQLYRPAIPLPRRLITVAMLREGGRWFTYQTMGMRKFGRPDLFVRHAGSRYKPELVDLLEEYAEFQAFGGTIKSGQRVSGTGLPGTGKARYVSNPTDPDSLEMLVEFVWSKGALAPRWWWFW